MTQSARAQSVRRRPTIRAVADLAGVSQTTVSFVINNKPGAAISEATRKRVWQAVAQLDYRPNHAARSLSMRRSNLIGFISDRIASGSIGGQSLLGAQSVAWGQGRLLLIVDTDADEAIQRAAVDQLLSRQVEGMLIGASSLKEWRPPDVLQEVPTVLINCYDPEERYPSVIADEFGGGYSATAHLTKAGHKRIGLINGAPETESSRRRQEGFRAAMRDANLEHDPDLEVTTSWFPEGGRRGASTLFDLPDPPTAIFCLNDWIAMGVYQEAADRGRRIPEDVAVIGYDDQDFASGLQPGLTTLASPHEQIGKRAADLLMARRGDRAMPYEVIEVPCPLILRESA